MDEKEGRSLRLFFLPLSSKEATTRVGFFRVGLNAQLGKADFQRLLVPTLLFGPITEKRLAKDFASRPSLPFTR